LIVTLAFLCPIIFWAQESGDSIKENAKPRIDNSYILAGKDVPTISVFDEASLSTTQPIDGNNAIKVPLIGKIKIGGLTVRRG
jgi:protein involved in polysaccharide export with SLBB domain